MDKNIFSYRFFLTWINLKYRRGRKSSIYLYIVWEMTTEALSRAEEKPRKKRNAQTK